ncbi:MAG: arylsulfatase [Flavobacteriales bacterium]|nr:arylsulfatase [Flavobacteriales bacterium]
MLRMASMCAITALVAGCRTPASKAEEQDVDTHSPGSVLPFPARPSESVTGRSLADSKLAPWSTGSHLPKDPPNILVILIDDIGYGVAETFGGEVRTPNLSKLAGEGITYNRFHTTAICSPTRASLLTGRNHTRVGNGTIAERAVNFAGYTGVMPKTSATFPEVLKNYGYSTAAFGKWHNTPADQTTAMGPFDKWPTGYGFEYFYGFMAGETSQYEPRLYENTNPVEPPHDETYHLTEDMADKALAWLSRHGSYAKDKPFMMYWAPGAVHGPHHIFKEWADKYKGKFDGGWDAYRERTFKRQKEMGWIPQDAVLTERDPTMTAWDSIPESERPFQNRLMELYAGFTEHTDAQMGKLLDGMERMGLKENTIVVVVWGDNGSSAEGQNGSISELLAQNQIPNTVAQQIEALNRIGGLEALGTAKTDNMYHSGWAWAGCTPFRSTKLVAAHFGGTRNPMVISWPGHITPDKTPRPQFHHVNDLSPTVYELLGITPPKVVNGFEQDPIDGVSMVYSFKDPKAPGQKKAQFFDNNGSRGIYSDEWYACTFGPLYPWISAQKGLDQWNSETDVWQLYDLRTDFTQAHDVSKENPEKLKELMALFDREAEANQDFPIGAGIWLRLHPEDRIKSPYRSWTFDQHSVRMPEFTAPALGNSSNKVVLDVEVGKEASGVLYALGGSGGGLTCYMEKGTLIYEYNMMIIHNWSAASASKLAAGKHRIEVTTQVKDNKPGGPAMVTLVVDGNEVGNVQLMGTVPAAFTASETFDIGVDLGSVVSLKYMHRAPFKFNGSIHSAKVDLL